MQGYVSKTQYLGPASYGRLETHQWHDRCVVRVLRLGLYLSLIRFYFSRDYK